jgi:hypothetical protein
MDEIPSEKRENRTCCLTVLIVCGTFVVLCWYGLREMGQSARAASCVNDVWELISTFRSYAMAHEGLVPPIDDTRGNVTIEPDGFYPEHLENSCWLQCEWSPTRRNLEKRANLGIAGFNDDSFVYLPWRITTEAEGLAFVEAYKTLEMDKREEDLVVELDGAEVVLPRNTFDLDAAPYGSDGYVRSTIPILVEWPDHTHDDGVVLFNDGHLRRFKFGDGFPMTAAFIEGLREIASLDGAIPDWNWKALY